MVVLGVGVVFFFKQKTAYEMRISDWSSDVCSSDLGGVLMIKSNDLSLYTVITTGNTLPGLSCVRALNCLQNSMMFTPFAPKAGPTGGDGFAAPPFTCNFTNALTSLDRKSTRLNSSH